MGARKRVRTAETWDPEEEFEVEKIVDEKLDPKGNVMLYRVRWLNYSSRSDTWEPPSNLVGCTAVLRDWHKKQKRPLPAELLTPEERQNIPKVVKKTSSSPSARTSLGNSTPVARTSKGKQDSRGTSSRRSSTNKHKQKSKRGHDTNDDQEDLYSFFGSTKRPRKTSAEATEIIEIDVEDDNAPDTEIPKADDENTKEDLIVKPPSPLQKQFIIYPVSRPPTRDAYAHFSNYEKRELFRDRLRQLRGPEITLVNEVDDEPCPSLDFQFISEYRLTEGVIPPDPNFQSGCNCPSEGCNLLEPNSCQCLEDMDDPRSFAYDEHGRLRPDSGNVIYECNDFCSCSMDCPNRVVQRGRVLPLEVFKTKDKGWGVRTIRTVKAGTFVTCYLGEVISSHEAAERDKNYEKDGITYLFDLDMFDDASEYTVDAQRYGDVSRFFNHSCSPNLAIYSVVRNRGVRTIYDLAMFSIKDINPMEELTFDYAGIREQVSPVPKEPKQPIRHGKAYRKCRCGAPNCRGWLFS
ncbi:histone H3 methyltransferase Clr4 [Schizosaccharomyces japonicus yFS275]|uniref:Histone-lysine N-methyltransferase n=1 Tax=Schizosaccharomyces japonicus (strain yFS275 / FY16936) TaxID=402676 RepID=B6K768_SCHJY|nr:histone H3 methyltransferase Clr4 [Schizosaccharomyces japonicus yFS275]EEB09372.2 histone H3 methyltransferase Clr4 [Schizosaccharomyces japonicus yFS275]